MVVLVTPPGADLRILRGGGGGQGPRKGIEEGGGGAGSAKRQVRGNVHTDNKKTT